MSGGSARRIPSSCAAGTAQARPSTRTRTSPSGRSGRTAAALVPR